VAAAVTLWLAGSFNNLHQPRLGWWLVATYFVAALVTDLIPRRFAEHRGVAFFTVVAGMLAGGFLADFVNGDSRLMLGFGGVSVLAAFWGIVQFLYISPPPTGIWWEYPYDNPKFQSWKRSLPMFGRSGCWLWREPDFETVHRSLSEDR